MAFKSAINPKQNKCKEYQTWAFCSKTAESIQRIKDPSYSKELSCDFSTEIRGQKNRNANFKVLKENNC